MNRFLIKYVIVILLLFTTNTVFSKSGDLDLAIINATIIDGTGKPGFKGHVYVHNNKISNVDKQESKPRKAKKTIDAKGRVLSPGFIDLHSHGNPLFHGDFHNFIAMGVTTISLGQDGFSPSTERLKYWIKNVHEKGINPNIAMYLGHGTLRTLAGVKEDVDITPEQQQKMEAILKVNLPLVFGMTTGLEYSPALYADSDELLALAKIVGSENKLIMSHMRNEDDDAIINSLNELIDQGQYSRVHVSHMKSVYGKGAERAEEILQVIHQARDKGVTITADVYPYSASYTSIAIVFPDWAKTNEQLAIAKKTRREELETFIRNKVNARNGPESTLFGTAPYRGKTLKQVAKEAGKPFEQVLIDDIGTESVSAAYFVMNDALQSRFIQDPLVAVASDGSPVSYHPRGHGTFAKVIEEFVYNRNLFPLEQAIHKISGFPAEIIPLEKRGIIKEGNHADLILFEPTNVTAKANYGSPHQHASGFDYVIVNGKIVLENGKFNDPHSGHVLTPGS